jgi:UDP-N-acetylmuramyl pentapeptide phosphotransferase/UDP-N-acetylglucosamine-1-phosphate transferase
MLKELLLNLGLIAPLTFIGSFLATSYFIPKIIWIVNSHDLIDHPDHRSAHKTSTPTMAGVAFFCTFILAVFFIKQWDKDLISINLVASITVIFIIGLKDDLVMSTPKAKIIGEIVAISFILLCTCMQVNSLQGFLGIDTLPILVSYVLIALMILTIINSYNLLDGIDGLLSTVGILVFSVYSFIFFKLDLFFYFLLCLSLIGILLAYLRFNFSSSQKIFMGDTGSLIIGFCIGFFTLKFLSLDVSLIESSFLLPENKVTIIAAILFIPLLDTIRVMGVRLLNKKSPFHPDRNHLHHILIDLKIPHYKASLLLGFINISIVIFTFYLSSKFNSFILLGLLFIIFLVFLGLFNILTTSKKEFN